MIRRHRSPLLISAVVHVIVFAGLVQLFAMPNPLRRWLERERVEFQVERIGYISLPATAAVSKPGRRGGDDRPETAAPPVRAPLIAPGVQNGPSAVTPAPFRTGGQVAEGGSGPLVGGGGPLRGVQPAFHDPRLWTIPDRLVTAPRSRSERVDSVFSERFAEMVDSINRVHVEGPTRDILGMTTGGVLAHGVLKPMLPLRPPPGRMDETRRLYAMRLELVQQSQRRLNEDEFRQAAHRIRERKDREREQQQKSRGQKEIAAPSGGSDR